MIIRRNWGLLKNEFITGEFLTITNFFIDKSIKDNSRSRLHTKGWLVERKGYQEEILKRTRERVIEKETDIRLRQLKRAQQLQMKGLNELHNLPVKRIEDARKLLVSGMEIERKILGLNGKSHTNLTQLNVSLPKTRLDEIIESLDYAELLDFTAQIKKERARRSAEKVEKQ